MQKTLLLILALAMLMFMGCTKQETKENLHNVNQGFKNSWNKTKEAFSDGTESFKEETK